MTNIPGLYAVGEVDYQYHGANRLGANSLLSCLFAGLVTGPAVIEYAKSLRSRAEDLSSQIFEQEAVKWKDRFKAIQSMNGSENPFRLHQEMGELMIKTCTIVRNNEALKQTIDTLDNMSERWKNCNSLDTGHARNQSVLFINQLWNMIELAKVIAKGALLRDECRGSHLKPEFKLTQPKDTQSPEYQQFLTRWKENNKKWLKTTIAEWTEKGPEISFEEVDTSLIEPTPRRYD